MKKFSERILNEAVTPGNALLTTGVANHYTPVQNILTNIRNLFCSMLGIVAEIGEDGLSIKLSSSQFVSQQKTNELLWRPMYNDVSYGTSSLYGYITAQGLTKVTTVSLGAYLVVYFSPDDIRAAKDPVSMEPDAVCAKVDGCDCGCGCDCDCGCDCCCPCPCEANESLYDEFEMTRVNEEDNESDKIEVDDVTNVCNIVNNADKIVAAKQLDIIVSQKLQLPREYYFASVKFKNGDEAIALRWKYNKQLPTGKSTESTRSIMHIFGAGTNGIWIQDYAENSIVQLPDDVKNIIEKVLEILGAQKTNDPALFSLMGMGMSNINNPEEQSDENDSDDKDDNDSDNKKDEKDDNKSDEKDDKNTDDISL